VQHVEQYGVANKGLGAQISPKFRILSEYLLQNVEPRGNADLQVRGQRKQLLNMLRVDFGGGWRHIRRVTFNLLKAVDHGVGLQRSVEGVCVLQHASVVDDLCKCAANDLTQ